MKDSSAAPPAASPAAAEAAPASPISDATSPMADAGTSASARDAAPPEEASDASSAGSLPPPVRPELAEEVDVWWGSCSSLALVPGTVVCVLLTGVLGLGVWLWLPRGSMQIGFLVLGSVVWFLWALRFGYFWFGLNYRLTSRRLFRDKGFWRPEYVEVRLESIVGVDIERRFIESLLHIGRIVLTLDDPARRMLTLEGIRRPTAVAQLLRQWSQAARAGNKRAE